MPSQIDQLKIQFNGLTTAQKKQFILNLKNKLQNSNNVEYKRFLNECIAQYNNEVQNGAQSHSIPQKALAHDAVTSSARNAPAQDFSNDSPDYQQPVASYSKKPAAVKWLVAGIIVLVIVCGGLVAVIASGGSRPSAADNEVSAASGAIASERAGNTVSPAPNQKNSISSAVKYTDGMPFSDGVAWVKTSDKASDELWNCVDKTGKILISLGTGEQPCSFFSNNVALVKRADKTVEMIDKSGAVVSSPKTGGYDKIMGFVPELGLALVYKTDAKLEGTQYLSGFIDNKGNWAMEPISDQVLIDIGKSTDGRDSMNIEYIGGGVIRTCYDWGIMWFSYKDGFFNINTGESFTIDYYQTFGNNPFIYTGSDNYSPANLYPYPALRNIENGYGIFYSGVENVDDVIGSIYSINADLQQKEILTDVGFATDGGYAIVGRYKNGLFFYKDNSEAVKSMGVLADYLTNYTEGFYDIDGNLVIDLSQYNIQATPEFTDDGYCLLTMANPQGDQFYTIIDTHGNMNFEARPQEGVSMQYNGETQHAFYPIVLSCGRVVMHDSDNDYYIIDTSGEKVVDLGKVGSVSDFSEDAAMVKDNTGFVYYIDTTGNRLF